MSSNSNFSLLRAVTQIPGAALGPPSLTRSMTVAPDDAADDAAGEAQGGEAQGGEPQGGEPQGGDATAADATAADATAADATAADATAADATAADATAADATAADATATTDVSTDAKTVAADDATADASTEPSTVADQYMEEMAQTYATQGIVRSDMEKALNENAFLDFNEYVERHPGYKVLLIIGSTSEWSPSSAELLRANIKTYAACNDGKVIIVTGANLTADGGKAGANEVAWDVTMELVDSCGFDVKFCIMAPEFNKVTGNLTGTKQDMKVDVGIAGRADKTFVTSKDGGGGIRQIAMAALCAAVGADIACFEGGEGTANEFESALKRRKLGKGCKNVVFTVNSTFMLTHYFKRT